MIEEYEIVKKGQSHDRTEAAFGMLLWFILGALWFGPVAGHIVNIYTCEIWPSEKIETGYSADMWRSIK